MGFLRFFLVFIPISIVAEFMKLDSVWIFILSSISIIPLAWFMGKATEEISVYSGPRVGGFLNATFGNATELIISFFALKEGLFDVVKASIAGSVIGNILLVLGASMFFGGLKYKIQKFNRKVIEVSSSMLLFAVIGLSIPAIFTYTMDTELIANKYQWLSISIALSMFIIYLLGLYFSFYTHKDLYGSDHEESTEAIWGLKKSILVLVICTLIIALESEFLVGSVEPMTESLSLSKIFVGIIIIPIIGNAAEHSTAIIMAVKNKMDVAIEIAVGSSLQIILFVAPVLVFLSLLFKPMSIVFNKFELVSIIVSVLIVNRVASDGESNWLEGIQLLAVYIITALSFLI
ncbi:calcium/proton exchanger [Clostridium sp. P21]|uniref:Ca(2+)/H(+) antiporter n=1 Tax=Clostridium muellerianum TaxID=2716538 RepID=A0A7Y0ED79_9CLOT|nr:calcium/proton exchanger [Clostridium muellerianum]NMM61331.1 calcium/proton exchanger [Clostridium muellerianum]